jgi:regulatory protein YycH of two-component signal transduction system YycFG
MKNESDKDDKDENNKNNKIENEIMNEEKKFDMSEIRLVHELVEKCFEHFMSESETIDFILKNNPQIDKKLPKLS